MKKIILLVGILLFALSVNTFGQNNKRNRKVKKTKSVIQYNTTDWDFLRRKNKQTSKQRKKSFRPEIEDEVIVALRKKQTKVKVSNRRKSTQVRSSHDKYANQEVSYRKKSKIKKVRGVTHDPEFETWANRKRKTKKTRKQ